jgi:N-acetylglucosaminyl-diphospho-decaprenol L-rhamnosyltransferase
LSTDAETEGAPDDTPRWAAVIVNYESGELLVACVRSVLADESAGEPEVVVVDNGSRDGSVASVTRAFPSTRVVDAGVNLGYGAGANRGIAATAAPVVAVCNSDIEVRPGTGAAMLARFDLEPDLAALGPRIDNPDGTHYPSARSVPSTRDAVGHALLGAIHPRNPFTRRYRQLDVDPGRPRDVEWLSGAAMWLRRSAIDSIGGWDEHYFMYGEDVDLCWRLRRLGWRVGYEPRGHVTHVQGASTEHHPYRMIVRHHRSVYRFATKRWHGARRLLLVPAAVLLTVRAAFAIVARALGSRRRRPQVTH